MSPRPAALVLASALGLSACAAAPAGDGRLEVLASIYPLQFVAEQVGGEHVTVEPLTPPGAEPHDVELSPRQVRSVGEADVVVVLTGFQAAVDAALEARAPEHVVDAAATPAVAEHLAEHPDEEAEGAGTDDGHDHEGGDPHFWLDPTLLAAVATDVAVTLGEADPEHAEDYAANAEALGADLGTLDGELAAGLAQCERRVVVTAHEAFGYLAERYDLEQVGISGLDPEAEPSPARLREIRDTVEAHGVTTVFTETLVSPKVAETLAADLGIGTAVLDPLESQTDAAHDYRDVMATNLEALRAALSCT
ncbi:metal ABC transporter substrate-binding protein [Actinotalea solisilvae]|uniref:metal ABC transporter substrate-binding protein n=1 Tax=Actinotalea solisilvae TaxID=2072922 RepID=UPI0018F15112|nr:metal ABC transporter substrate-binding protein [Actinotalea solisilvae]